MQKVKEWVSKDKDLEDLKSDLSKNSLKSIPKLLEFYTEILHFDLSWNLGTQDPSKARLHIGKLELLISHCLSSLVSGTYTFDISQIDSIITSILTHEWSAMHCLSLPLYESLKNFLIKSLSRILRKIIKIVGSSTLHPKFIKIIRGLASIGEMSKEKSLMLGCYLVAVGNSGVDIVGEYLAKYKIVEKVVQELSFICCDQNVVLSQSKKNSKKKTGNAHQRRHHKNMIKKSENKILKSITEDKTENMSQECLLANLKLIRVYLVSNPIENIDLDLVFNMQVGSFTGEMLFRTVEMMFYYVMLKRKFVRKMRNLLLGLVKNVDFRACARHFLFLIDTLNSL